MYVLHLYFIFSKEKRLIPEEADLCGLQQMLRKWRVAPNTIATWKKEAYVEVTRNKNGRKISFGRPLTYDSRFEEKIVAWIHEQRDFQACVSCESIQRQARALLKDTNPGFVASNGWLGKFMDRNNFSIRKHMLLSQKLPGDLEVWLTVFYRHPKELRLEHELDEDVLLINMDDVPMTFDTVPSVKQKSNHEPFILEVTKTYV